MLGLFLFFLIPVGARLSFSTEAVLTLAEMEWLEAHPVIRFAPDLHYAPVEYEENGTVKGIAMDYLKWMEENYPVHFELVMYPTWSEQLDAMRNNQIDMLSGAAETPERSEYMNFTKPYIITPNAIMRRIDHKAITSESEFLTMKVAAIKGYAVAEYLSIRYPNLEVVLVKDIEEGLLKVVNGEVDAMVAEVFQASFYISSMKLSNVVIENAYKVDFPIKLAMATRKSEPELTVILDKMIDSMPDDKQIEIERKWIGINNVNQLPKNLLYGLLIGLAIMFGLIVSVVFWNRTLKRRVDQKTSELTELNVQLEAKVERRTHLLSETNRQLELSMYTLQLRDQELQKLNDELEKSLSALQFSQKKLIEMEKVAALGKLVATVAHEINTPLGNCIMMTSYEWDRHVEFKAHLRAKNQIDTNTEDYFDAIKNIHDIYGNSFGRLTTIVNRFKSLAVQNLDQKKELFNVSELIEECMIQYRQHHVFTWTLNSNNDNALVYGIKSAYAEVFSNLISNAVMHGFAEPFDGEGQVDVSLDYEENSLVVEIKDNGIGIPDELITKVTEPLFTTNRMGGIGLNIVMNILGHTLDGEMALDNKQEHGLRVVVILKNVIWQDYKTNITTDGEDKK